MKICYGVFCNVQTYRTFLTQFLFNFSQVFNVFLFNFSHNTLLCSQLLYCIKLCLLLACYIVSNGWTKPLAFSQLRKTSLLSRVLFSLCFAKCNFRRSVLCQYLYMGLKINRENKLLRGFKWHIKKPFWHNQVKLPQSLYFRGLTSFWRFKGLVFIFSHFDVQKTYTFLTGLCALSYCVLLTFQGALIQGALIQGKGACMPFFVNFMPFFVNGFAKGLVWLCQLLYIDCEKMYIFTQF